MKTKLNSKARLAIVIVVVQLSVWLACWLTLANREKNWFAIPLVVTSVFIFFVSFHLAALWIESGDEP